MYLSAKTKVTFIFTVILLVTPTVISHIFTSNSIVNVQVVVVLSFNVISLLNIGLVKELL